jgi:hypothetical protein
MELSCQVRAACDNCGFVSTYQIPFKSTIVDFNYEYGDEAVSHTITWMEKQKNLLICSNCGLPKLEVVYWDQSKIEDPFISSLRFKSN